MQDVTQDHLPSLRQALRVWAKIGLLSFGGPTGQIALMHKELVEQRGWISEQRFLHALNFCMVLPGPEAQQLATYIGWLMHGTLGGLVAGLLFVLPGALVMLGLSVLYVTAHQVPLIGALFFGIKAAVVVLVLQAMMRIAGRALRSGLHRAIALVSFLAIAVAQVPFGVIVVAAGISGLLMAARLGGSGSQHAASGAGHDGLIDRLMLNGQIKPVRPSLARLVRIGCIGLPLWLAPVLVLLILAGPASVWTQMGTYFSGLALITFGGAYAILASVAQAAVGVWHWMSAGEMADGLGLAETTPGPLILVLQFVGFVAAWRHAGWEAALWAGCFGAVLTSWVTFVPSFLLVFAGAPYSEALRGNRRMAAALSAISAAIVGVVGNLALWFALNVLFARMSPLHFYGWNWDLPVLASFQWGAAAMALLAGVLLLKLRWSLPAVLALSALGGAIIRLGIG